jgi:thioredoxin 1
MDSTIGTRWVLAAMVAGTAMAGDAPRVFGTRTVREAIEAGARDGKLVILDATATWCAPCKTMDATTWVQPEVEKWIGDHAIAAQFDIDKDADSARAYNIAAMPTIIVVRNGVEFDRVTGYRTAEQLLGWLSGVREGKTLQAQQAEPTFRERLKIARDKVYSQRLPDALADYLWLWDNIEKVYPDQVGEKSDSLVVCLRDISLRLPEARPKIVEMRDALAPGSSKDPATARDYVALCRALDDTDSVIAWFEKNRGAANFRELWRGCGPQLETVLIQRDRWADVGTYVEDPVGRLRGVHERMLKIVAELEKEDRMPETIIAERSRYSAEAVRLYVSLLAAGREQDAAAIEAEATSVDPSPFLRGLLLTKTLDHNQARAFHEAWLKPELANTLDIEDARRRIREQAAKRR